MILLSVFLLPPKKSFKKEKRLEFNCNFRRLGGNWVRDLKGRESVGKLKERISMKVYFEEDSLLGLEVFIVSVDFF